MLWREIHKYKELSSVNSQELILGLVPQETDLSQSRDMISSTRGKSVYGYVGLRTTGTPKALEIVCLSIANS